MILLQETQPTGNYSTNPTHHSTGAHSSCPDYRGKELICVKIDDAKGHCDEKLANNGQDSNEPIMILGNGHDAQH